MRKTKLLKRRALALVVSGLLAASLAGCGGSTSKASSAAALSSLSGEIDTGALEGRAATLLKNYKGYLGYGYNTLDSTVFTESSISSAAYVLDMDTLANQDKVYSSDLNELTTTYVYDDTFLGVLKKVSKYNGLPGDAEFGGLYTELDVSKSDIEETQTRGEAFLAYASSEIKTSREYIEGGNKASKLRKYIMPEFKDFVEKNSAADIVDTYGTMVLTEVVKGGRFDLLWYSTELSDYTAKEVSSGMSAYVDGVTEETAKAMGMDKKPENEGDYIEVNGSEAEQSSKAYKFFMEHCTKKSAVYGGSASISIDNFAKSAEAFTKWGQSVPGSSVMINAAKSIALSDIIATFNTDKAKEVADYIEAEKNKLKESVKAD